MSDDDRALYDRAYEVATGDWAEKLAGALGPAADRMDWPGMLAEVARLRTRLESIALALGWRAESAQDVPGMAEEIGRLRENNHEAWLGVRSLRVEREDLAAELDRLRAVEGAAREYVTQYDADLDGGAAEESAAAWKRLCALRDALATGQPPPASLARGRGEGAGKYPVGARVTIHGHGDGTVVDGWVAVKLDDPHEYDVHLAWHADVQPAEEEDE